MGIPMGTNGAPPVADLFLFRYERDVSFLRKAIWSYWSFQLDV